MADNAIAKGSLVLTASADKMLSELDRASKGADKAAKDINKNLGGGKGGKGGGGGGLGSLVGGFLGGFVGAAIGHLLEEPLQRVGNAMKNLVTNSHEFQMALERSGEQAEYMARALDRSLRRSDEKLGSIADPKALGLELNRQIAATQEAMMLQEKIREGARKAKWELKDDGALESWGAYLTGNLDDELAKAEQQFNAASAAAQKLEERLMDLNQKSSRVKNPAGDPAVIGAVNQLTESLKLQADTFGMTGAQAQVAALRAKGASADMLAAAQAQADRLDELQKNAQMGSVDPSKLSGAMMKGSVEAYSLVAKFQTVNALAEGQQKKQEAQVRESNRILGQILKAVTGTEILKVI